ncbi:MAG: hypothetical protein HYT77_07010 [Deltaproteobacteria bacterium]|nr:hypothetical protein [Deltaproteobacteria bacterium]
MSKKSEVESDDPLEIVQAFFDVPADNSFYREMARTFIEEYMMIGWADDEILALFHEPYYRGTYDILQKKGETFVKNIIDEVRHG